ncbi:hypothetical protein HJD18_14560 [Thermoleophilia bacterium SCSIO 60948]|nr:hypothetical protein HJD18_14560 [Thermoleophilia bacterium SCSIO 60948]
MLASLAIAGPAAAAVTKSGPIRYSAESLSYGAGSSAEVSAPCPGASRIAAVGGSVASTTNSIGLSNLRIAGTRDGASSTGYNDGSEQTRQRTTAVCLTKGGDSLSYSATDGTVSTEGSTASGGVSCTTGRIVAGALATSGLIGAVQLEELTPVLDGRRVNRTTLEWSFSKASTPTELSYEATAICLPPAAGRLRHVYRARVAFGGETTVVRAPCPKGTRAIGGGTGRLPFALQASQPYDDGDPGRVPDDGWMSRTYDPSTQAVVTHAVCLA